MSAPFNDLIRACLHTDHLLAKGCANEGEARVATSEPASDLGRQVKRLLAGHGQTVPASVCVLAAQTILANEAVTSGMAPRELSDPSLRKGSFLMGSLLRFCAGAAVFVTGHQLWAQVGPRLGPVPHLTGVARVLAQGVALVFEGTGSLLLISPFIELLVAGPLLVAFWWTGGFKPKAIA